MCAVWQPEIQMARFSTPLTMLALRVVGFSLMTKGLARHGLD
jgi:hypothetical protein